MSRAKRAKTLTILSVLVMVVFLSIGYGTLMALVDGPSVVIGELAAVLG